MQEPERGEFANVIQGMCELYDKPLSPTVLNIWWTAMAPYDLAAVEYALEQHVRDPDEGQFMPKPNAVVKFLEGNSNDRALRAWALVAQGIRSVGQHNSVVFPDPLIHAVISEMGGWPKLCSTSTEEMPFRAKEFENRYRTGLRHPPNGYPRVLAGLGDIHNQSTGQELDKPLLMGEKEQCALVYRGGYAERPQLQRLGSDELMSQIARISNKSGVPA